MNKNASAYPLNLQEISKYSNFEDDGANSWSLISNLSARQEGWLSMMEIYQQEVWKQCELRNFSDYCLEVLKCRKSHGYDQVKAGRTIDFLLKVKFREKYGLPLPNSVKIAARLAKVSEAKRVEAWIDCYYGQDCSTNRQLVKQHFRDRTKYQHLNIPVEEIIIRSFPNIEPDRSIDFMVG